jgi:hypothetical protein
MKFDRANKNENLGTKVKISQVIESDRRPAWAGIDGERQIPLAQILTSSWSRTTRNKPTLITPLTLKKA